MQDSYPFLKFRSAAIPWFFTKIWLLIFLGIANESLAGNLVEKETRDPIEGIKKTHPRILVSGTTFAHLKDLAKTSPEIRKWIDQIDANAKKILKQPPVTYEIPDGLRLLMTCRKVVDRTYVLCLAYRLTGDRHYLDREWKELTAAAEFPDWNPRHFLDTAEMTHAFAIGYDWLYDDWSPRQRAMLKKAILERGLQPALDVYLGRAKFSRSKWPKANHNWNQVCNGGIGVGALAIADAEPGISREILNFAIDSIPRAMKEYAPDGAWGEGPGYWQYATEYNVLFLAALESALGRDFGLSSIPGIDEAGAFPRYFCDPQNRVFSYADAHPGEFNGTPSLFWLARRYQQPSFAAFQIPFAMKKPQPLDLIWGGDWLLKKPALKSEPFGRAFRHSEIAVMRSSWNHPDALYLGIKGGDNACNHSHLDLGSFVLSALGENWVLHPGKDNYNLTGYFGKNRFDYYRLRAEGCNTIVLNPSKEPDQNPKGTAKIIRFDSTPKRSIAVLDLSNAYPKDAKSVFRGFCMLNRRAILIQDEITPSGAGLDVWWFMHTEAKLQIDAANHRRVTLSIGAKKLTATLLAPSTATFQILPALPLPSSPNPPGQASNKDFRKLAIHCAGTSGPVTISVLLSPETGEQTSALPEVIPLQRW